MDKDHRETKVHRQPSDNLHMVLPFLQPGYAAHNGSIVGHAVNILGCRRVQPQRVVLEDIHNELRTPRKPED